MVGVILGFVVAGVGRPFWMILDGICCPKYDRLTPRWLGEEEGGEKVHGSILGVTPRWLREEEGKRSTVQFWGF